ncbi:MAG TPA: hypothetical protein VM692_16475, partial [Gammaproteobacteria bacterium]|nr:hypothetical protein [Gammaproteobacteria bacterium]
MTYRIVVAALSAAHAAAALAAENIHFLAEHAVESGMDAVYTALPWPSGRLAPDHWQPSVDLAAAHTTTEFMRLEGNSVAAAANRGVNPRWGYELMASYGASDLSGGNGRVPLSVGFLDHVPLDLPQLADFSAVSGSQRQLSLGAAAVHERRTAASPYSSQLIAGLLLERVEVTGFRMQYLLLAGADAATSGTLEFSSRAGFVTPFVAWQQTRALAPRWTWSLRAMLAAPLPPAELDARLAAPRLGVSVASMRSAIEL